MGGLLDLAAGVLQFLAGGGGDGEVAGEAVVAVAGDELAFAGEQRFVFLPSAGGGDLAGFLAEGFVGELGSAGGLDLFEQPCGG